MADLPGDLNLVIFFKMLLLWNNAFHITLECLVLPLYPFQVLRGELSNIQVSWGHSRVILQEKKKQVKVDKPSRRENVQPHFVNSDSSVNASRRRKRGDFVVFFFVWWALNVDKYLMYYTHYYFLFSSSCNFFDSWQYLSFPIVKLFTLNNG